jgi:hypothetical protein
MASKNTEVSEILKKARLAKLRFEHLTKRLEQVEEELRNTKIQLKEQQEINKTLGEKIKMFKLAQRFLETSAADKGELKRKLNEMIRSVDLCIAQLSEENGA